MPVQSVDRAVAILDALTVTRGYLGVTELSNQLGLHKSTVHRLLASLQKGRLVERDPRTRKYRLGVRLVELGNAVLNSRGLAQVALPYLHFVADKVEEVTYLAIREGDTMLNVLQVPAPHLVQSVGWLSGAPLHSTSTGKVFLAHMAERERESYLKDALARLTEQTKTDRGQLLAELEEVRERGYATDWEEHEEGINAVGVPIRDSENQVVAAMGAVGPSYRFTREKTVLASEPMIAVAREIGKRLQPRTLDVFS
jgi:DNA-binding IclR family transcriptional regulator